MHACHAVAIDQLLSLRDGEPIDVVVAQHVRDCAACSHELMRLRGVQTALRTLPPVAAPTLDKFLGRTIAARTSSHVLKAGSIAVAASIGALALVVGFVNRDRPAPIHSVLQTSPTATPTEAARTRFSVVDPPLHRLVSRSQELDTRLQQLPARPHVERASTTNTIDQLQYRIQWVDYQLSLAGDVGLTENQSTGLWQDRVRLMDTLVKVRSAEAQRFALL